VKKIADRDLVRQLQVKASQVHHGPQPSNLPIQLLRYITPPIINSNNHY